MSVSAAQTPAIVVNPAADNVAVATRDLAEATTVSVDGMTVTLSRAIGKGERFAIRDIPSGEAVIQYGYPFGRSMGIARGEAITQENTPAVLPEAASSNGTPPGPAQLSPIYQSMTFRGFRRADGRCGTRNYYLIVPTSMCASATATAIARQFESSYRGIDGVIPLPTAEGCGCAGGLQIDRFLRIIANFSIHPNVAGVLFVDLGCEQTNAARVRGYFEKIGISGGTGRPFDWVTIQTAGGTAKAISRGQSIVADRLRALRDTVRQECPLSALVLGTECGASDAFSGISANRVMGNAADKVIFGGGAAIMSEMPEMQGAEQFLLPRMRSPESASRFLEMMEWYGTTASRMGYTMEDNLVPENRAGGLFNCYIKSLGAVMKGGTTPIEGVVDYGEAIQSTGLHIMQGPGNDLESVTGLAASGANMICFSTGRGTVTGSAIVPVIKVSSTTDLWRRLPDDIDFNAGPVLDSTNQAQAIETLGNELLARIIAAASGELTSPERHGQHQFQVWTAGKLSL